MNHTTALINELRGCLVAAADQLQRYKDIGAFSVNPGTTASIIARARVAIEKATTS